MSLQKTDVTEFHIGSFRIHAKCEDFEIRHPDCEEVSHTLHEIIKAVCSS